MIYCVDARISLELSYRNDILCGCMQLSGSFSSDGFVADGAYVVLGVSVATLGVASTLGASFTMGKDGSELLGVVKLKGSARFPRLPLCEAFRHQFRFNNPYMSPFVSADNPSNLPRLISRTASLLHATCSLLLQYMFTSVWVYALPDFTITTQMQIAMGFAASLCQLPIVLSMQLLSLASPLVAQGVTEASEAIGGGNEEEIETGERDDRDRDRGREAKTQQKASSSPVRASALQTEHDEQLEVTSVYRDAANDAPGRTDTAPQGPTSGAGASSSSSRGGVAEIIAERCACCACCHRLAALASSVSEGPRGRCGFCSMDTVRNCVALASVVIAMILPGYFGISFDMNRAKEWGVSFVASFLLDAVVLNLLKMLLFSYLLSHCVSSAGEMVSASAIELFQRRDDKRAQAVDNSTATAPSTTDTGVLPSAASAAAAYSECPTADRDDAMPVVESAVRIHLGETSQSLQSHESHGVAQSGPVVDASSPLAYRNPAESTLDCIDRGVAPNGSGNGNDDGLNATAERVAMEFVHERSQDGAANDADPVGGEGAKM